jgi:predicted transcriptional regulator YdeE
MIIQPIRFEQGQAMLLAGTRQYHLFITAHSTITQQWYDFVLNYWTLLPLGNRSFGATCMADDNGFEYMCAIEVDSFEHLATDIGRMIIKPQYYAIFTHQGDIANIGQTWRSIHEWIASSNYQAEHVPCFELYDQRYNPETSSGLVEIWVAIKNS